MASWNDVVREIDGLSRDIEDPLNTVRHKYVEALAELRGRNVICYYSGWLQRNDSEQTSILDNNMNGLMNAMHGLDRSKGLDLVLHTPGGDLAAAENIVNYLHGCFEGAIE